MEWPQDIKAAVVIRTHFGEIAAGPENFRHPVEELMKDPAWCEAARLVGGPFCYTDTQRDMLF